MPRRREGTARRREGKASLPTARPHTEIDPPHAGRGNDTKPHRRPPHAGRKPRPKAGEGERRKIYPPPAHAGRETPTQSGGRGETKNLPAARPHTEVDPPHAGRETRPLRKENMRAGTRRPPPKPTSPAPTPSSDVKCPAVGGTARRRETTPPSRGQPHHAGRARQVSQPPAPPIMTVPRRSHLF
jgi:hypothetical protein